MSDRAILIEVDVVSPAGAAKTLRYSDRAVRPFPASAASKANLVWDNRIIENPTFREALFGDVLTLKPTSGYGMLTLANADHQLDQYQGHAWGEVRVWRWTFGTPFTAAVQVLRGVCAQPMFDPRTSAATRVRVPLFDQGAELEKPIQTNTYAGTNGTGGVLYEGTAGGLKGRAKPLAFGNLLDAHLPAALVNPGSFVHQLHDGAIEGAEQIFDGGVAAGYIDDGDSANAAFDASAPAATHYRTDVGRSLVKINGSPVLGLTFGCKGDKTGGVYAETPGPVLARLLARAGVAGGQIGASVAALASAAVVGVYAPDQVNASELIGLVARSALAAIVPDRNGVWQAATIAPPKPVADFPLAFDQVIDLVPEDATPPIGEIRVGWGKVYTTFTSTELKPSIRNTATETQLGQEYRYAVLADAAVKGRFPKTWQTLTFDTALRQEAAATALAAQLQALFGLRADGSPRRMWRATVELTDAALALQLGSTVGLDYPPLGISENFLLVGRDLMRPRRDQALWTLWG